MFVLTGADNYLNCAKYKLSSATLLSNELRQIICTILRKRDGIIAIPSPFRGDELVGYSSSVGEIKNCKGDNWEATVSASDENVALSYYEPSDQSVISTLIERVLVYLFEKSHKYWRLNQSTRYWHEEQPEATVDEIEMIPRLSFATVPLSEGRIGIAFSFGHLFRTRMNVAEFIQGNQLKQFDRLRARQDGRKGTLLYNTGSKMVQVCYFQRLAPGIQASTTGPLPPINGVSYSSLHEYYRRHYPHLNVEPSDSVVYVSFPGIKHSTAVAAKLLRLRVALDKEIMPLQVRKSVTMPPHLRHDKTMSIWKNIKNKLLSMTGCDSEGGLWRPQGMAVEQLPCPVLEFGKGRIIKPPPKVHFDDYRQYYNKRGDILRNGGLYHFSEATPREVELIIPSSKKWSEKLRSKFVSDITECIQDISGRAFSFTVSQADTYDEITGILSKKDPTNTMIVYDKRELDSAAYYLLSHDLSNWTLKRITSNTITRAWNYLSAQGSLDQQQKAERNWSNTIFHSAIDMLDQMGAVMWKLQEWPYDACLTIDVGEDRKYFAISLLICRQDTFRPSFWRYVKAWPKGDSQHEAINPEILRDKIGQIWEKHEWTSFSPINSLLVLRDGQQCGKEPEAIMEGLKLWQKKDYLSQSAKVDHADVHKQSVKGLRMWRRNSRGIISNVLEGCAIYLSSKESLVACTGAATLSKNMTADPCILVTRDHADIRRITSAFFALTQLNYLSPRKAYSCPQPLHETDDELQSKMAREMRGIK